MKQNDVYSVIDFTSYVSQHTQDFTGREWVFKAVNDWLAKADRPRFFLLTGEPGSGKTAIASRLSQFTQGTVLPPDGLTQLTPDFLSAMHFCSARDSRWINPHVFAESLAMQLARHYPAYAKALAEKSGDRQIRIEVDQQLQNVMNGQVIGVDIKSLNVSGVAPEDAFNRVVREPLEALFHNGFAQQVIILVDALDEALLYSEKANIVSLLAQTNKLPPGVRFLLTSRQDERVENKFLDADGLFISAMEFNQDNQEDICHYVKDRLHDDKVLAEKASHLEPIQTTEAVRVITRKAEGNFLYVRFLLDAMAKGWRSLSEIEGLPEGLDELYFYSLRRVVELGGRDWLKDYAPLMGILSVAQESLTLTQLQAFTNKSESAIWNYLGNLQQFIEEVDPKIEQQVEETGQTRLIFEVPCRVGLQDEIRQGSSALREEKKYRLYHQSVIDFLRRQRLVIKKKQLRNSYYLPAEEWHIRIVDCYRARARSWEEVDWYKVDNYGLQYLTNHLYALRHFATYRQEFQRVICKPFMQAKRIHEGSHHAFAADVSLAITLSGDETPPDLVSQIRNAVLYATLGTVTNNIPGEILESVAFLGKADNALDMAALISDTQQRSSACFLIAKTLLKSGDTKNLTSALNRGLTALLTHIYDLMAKQAVSNNAIAEWLHDAAVLFDQAGMLDRFFSTYYRFAPAGLLNTMAILANNLAQKGQKPLAIHVAEAVKQWLQPEVDLPEHAVDFVYLANAFALSGEHQRAIEAAEHAAALINQRGDTTQLIWLAPVFVHAGQLDRALQLAKTIADSDAQDHAYREITEALTRLHQNDRALQIAQTIGWEKIRWDALAKVVASYADNGEFERGLDILETIEYPVQYTRALTGIIEAMVRAKKFAEAQTVLQCLDGLDSRRENGPRDIFGKPESVDKNFMSSYLLGEIALGMVSAGMDEQAKPIALRAAEVATHVEWEDNSLVLRLAAEALSALHLFEPVEAMLPFISDIAERSRAVSALMKAMTAQGMYTVAHDLLRSFNNAASIAAGVEVLARAHIQANNVDEAIQLVDMVPLAWNKTLVIGTLVKDLIDRNNSKRATCLLKQALLTMETNEDHTAILRLIPKICALLLEKGKAEASDELADVVLELANREIISERKAEGYAASAQVLLMLGDISTAVDAINSMGQLTVSQDSRLRLVLNIAQSAKGSTQSRIVTQLLNDVLPIIPEISTAREQSAWLVEVVQALSNVSAFEAALQMSGKITNKLHKALACCIVAKGFVREGMTEVASDLLGHALQASEHDFSGWEHEGQQLHFISEDIVKNLSGIADAENQRLEALSQLALTLTSIGRMKDAADVALRAEGLARKYWHVPSKCKVVEALARAGLPDRAESLYVEAEGQLTEIEDVAPRALAWVDLAHARIALNQADKARTCLENAVNLLTSASYYTRSDIFQVVSASAPIIAEWEDGQVLWKMCRAILEVEKWWN